MPKLILMQRFPARLTRSSYALVPVVDPEGRVKVLKVSPGNEKLTWVRPEWQRDRGGRATQLVSVDFTTEREQAGCLFLKQAYEAENWLEGWKQHESYVAAQFYVDYIDEAGVQRSRRRERPVERGHFPPELLPKRVLEMQARAKITAKGARWEPTGNVAHPDDTKAKRTRKEIDGEKLRIKAEMAKSLAQGQSG